MNVGSQSNTATAATAKLGKNKRKDAEVKGANKKSKDDTQAMEIEKTNDNQMIDDKEITTEVNVRTFDISNWMLENEATTEQIAASKIPFTKTLGIGSIQEALTAFIKIPAKVMRWQHKVPSPKEIAEVNKHGLKPEEWLLVGTLLEHV